MTEPEGNQVKQTLTALVESADREGMTDYLLIGGNAVIAHGVPRFTRDVDFVIPERVNLEWRSFLEQQGFFFLHGTTAFQQFHDSAGGKPGIDLMLVHESTWNKLSADAWILDLGGQLTARVASPQHIIAMKLKACLSEHRRDDAVDWSDIVELSRVHGFDPRTDEKFAAFVLEFGGETLLQKLIDEIADRRKRG